MDDNEAREERVRHGNMDLGSRTCPDRVQLFQSDFIPIFGDVEYLL